ncbi:MAG: restriction endonuclease subunit S, partial [Hymenobacter sp.]
MSNEMKKTALPKLRFPEFEDAPEWEAKKLDAVTISITPPKKLQTTEYLKEGSFPIIDQSQSFICGWTNDSAALIEKNLPLIIFGDHTCALKLAKVPFAQGADGIKILKSNQLIESNFLYQYLLFNPVKQEEYKRHYSILKEKVVCYPQKETGEQQKIAATLSSLDDLITAQNAKLAALQAHKRGLMQGLFPAEGETVPKLRFPEFQEAEEWEEKKLDEIARRGSGHTPSKSNPENYNGGIKWISLADSKRLDNGLITKTATEISMAGIKNSSAVLHPAGTVLISRDAGIGKSAVMGESMAVSQHFIVWVCNSDSLNNWFLYYLLQKSKPLFERAAIGSTIKTIGLQFFKDLVFLIPSFAEQQRIADCLSSLDNLITAQTQKIEALKLHKRGLM